MSALPAPSAGAFLTQWSWQPVAIGLAVALGWWYWRAVLRLRTAHGSWPRRRSVMYCLGLLLLLWTECGFPGTYSTSLYWAWSLRTLLIWLLVPAVLLAGKPLQLAHALDPDGAIPRALRSTPARVLGNPFVAPAVVPVLSGVLFFSSVASWSVQAPPFGWACDAVLLMLGTVALATILGPDNHASGLAVGGALAIGMLELILDAVPGIALRLQTHLVSPFFAHIHHHSWTLRPLHDQQLGGAILWAVAEAIDLPFLIIVFVAWIRADARDAAQVDAVLEAERIARRCEPSEAGRGDVDAPWWLHDDEMRRRLGH